MPSSKAVQIADLEIFDLKNVTRSKGSGARPSSLPGSNNGEFGGHNIVTIDMPKQQKIKEFQPEKIREQGLIYSEVKKSFPKDNSHNSRFQISELARKPLRIDQEEEQRIESEIKSRLDEQMDILRELVRKEGYEAGFSAGLDEGKQEINDKSKPLFESLNNIVTGFESMRSEVFKANEEFVIRMVYNIAKSVILKEIQEDKDYVLRLVETILERLGTRENIKIFVSAKEFSSAQKLKEDLAKNFGELKNITIELDDQILGGCRVETDFSEVDARLEGQIEGVAKTLGVKS